MQWVLFTIHRLIKYYRIQKMLYGRNPPDILQTVIMKSRRKIKQRIYRIALYQI